MMPGSMDPNRPGMSLPFSWLPVPLSLWFPGLTSLTVSCPLCSGLLCSSRPSTAGLSGDGEYGWPGMLPPLTGT